MLENRVGLYIVEGPSGSGKDAILQEMAKMGAHILRGMSSQHPEDNLTLTPEAQQLLGNRILNFKTDIALPKEERTLVMETVFSISRLQQLEALRLLQLGRMVFLNRSAISLAALMEVAGKVSAMQGFLDRAAWFDQRSKLAEDLLLTDRFYQNISGIIFLNKPYLDTINTRAGMSGLEELEAKHQANILTRLSRSHGVPTLIIDPNQQSIEQEIELVSNFIRLHSLL